MMASYKWLKKDVLKLNARGGLFFVPGVSEKTRVFLNREDGENS
jgi:hypothetical protein